MGLAMAEDLARKGWKVAILDINDKAGHVVEGKFAGQVTYHRANVADYEAQASAFAAVFRAWHRLDFVWANAGIADRLPFLDPPTTPDGTSPPRPDTLVIEVDFHGAIYSSYLALFYFRRNATAGGKLIITSSTAGLYPNIALPLYGAAKHGVRAVLRSYLVVDY
jgi:NAD(P)-dependent dehydrogenase (short-subunit alcohol dehydrogenase family)